MPLNEIGGARFARPTLLHYFTSRSNSSSLITFTPSYSALASLLPAFSPATR